MKVLIAEDERVSRRLLEILLNKWGYEVMIASDGAQAWQMLDRPDAPRIALLDWMMPEMDGMQLCRKIKRRRCAAFTYVLLLSAKQEEKDFEEGFKAGADDYLTKPVAARELQSRLRIAERIVDLKDQLASANRLLNNRTAPVS